MNVTISVDATRYINAMSIVRHLGNGDGGEPPDGVLAPTGPHGPQPTLDGHVSADPS